MSRIKESVVKAVHDLNILDVLRPYGFELKRSGSSYMCRCPFHSEKSASFSVSPSKNICKCFSCGKGGDPLHFVMEYDGLTYREAIEQLARQHNIPLEYEDGEQNEKDAQEERKREAMKLALSTAQDFFVEQFKADNPEAQAARDYAYSRWGEEYCTKTASAMRPKPRKYSLTTCVARASTLNPL